jgi:simple sugar transport system substrate-binding protein
MPPRRLMKLALGVALFAFVTPLLTSASASTGSSAAKQASSLIICVCGPTSDPFFGAYKLGNDIAAKNLGVKVQYSAAATENALAADMVPLFKAAIAKKPAAMVVGDYIPSAFDPYIKQAVKAGIPVVITSVGDTSWQADGAIGFVGENPALMGSTAANLQLKAGAKSGLCVNHLPGAGTLQARCDAYIATMKAAGATAFQLSIPSVDNSNDQLMTNDMVGTLRSHPDVDAIFTLGPTEAIDATNARTQVGRKIVVGTTDLSIADLNAVKSGTLLFALDQQPFLQGYYGVQIAAQYIKYRVAPAGQVGTGPFVINKSNVAKVLATMKTYPGIRGAA